MKQRKKWKIIERVEGAKKVLTKGKRGDIIAELSQGSEKQIAERTAWYLENRIVKQNKT